MNACFALLWFDCENIFIDSVWCSFLVFFSEMCDIKICRICLNKEVKLFQLDQFNLRHYYEQIMNSKVKRTFFYVYYYFPLRTYLSLNNNKCTSPRLSLPGSWQYVIPFTTKFHPNPFIRYYLDEWGNKQWQFHTHKLCIFMQYYFKYINLISSTVLTYLLSHMLIIVYILN